ncbi:hypothetical protein [Actinoplanes sp. URMC 104]|uniref:hypothetical protein n=1 Tax=Actinoplanes sp. URMC 104 TaxID=3423409 RepID=UPI003F1AAE10
MTTFGQLEDTDIDIAIDESDAGERRGMELAARLRLVAAQDPDLAQELVDNLIVALDKAMGGNFRDYLEGDARAAADRVLAEGNSPTRNS